jgi:predicted RNA-binding protein YlxR (DUF448 family)
MRETAEMSARERRCIATGEILPEARLLRFVRGPEGSLVPDIEAKLPGRGLWVRAERSVIEQAAAKNLFAKAAKAPVAADGKFVERTEARLVERMLAHLGLARRAGELFLGFDQVEKALRSLRPPAVIIEAAEAAPDDGANCRPRRAHKAVSRSLLVRLQTRN